MGSIAQELPVVVQLSAASVGLLVFGLWGLDSPVRFIWGSAAKVLLFSYTGKSHVLFSSFSKVFWGVIFLVLG